MLNFHLKKKEVFGILSPRWKNFEGFDFPPFALSLLCWLCFGGNKDFIIYAESGSIFRPYTGSQHANLSYAERWNAIWDVIENIYITAVECGQLWKEDSKSQGKRRALSSLLKLLESSGLSRHKSTFWEV